MTLPNKLTVLRIFMIPLFLVFLCVPLPLSDATCRICAAVVFALASLTDMLDGKIARKYGLVTDFGKLMDPLADKCMVISAMLGILVYCYDLRYLFVWATAVVVFRELAVTSLRLLAASRGGEVIAAAWLGKVKTVTQIACVLLTLLEPVILPFSPFAEGHILAVVSAAAMIVMTVWSGISYFVSYKNYLK